MKEVWCKCLTNILKCVYYKSLLVHNKIAAIKVGDPRGSLFLTR